MSGRIVVATPFDPHPSMLRASRSAVLFGPTAGLLLAGAVTAQGVFGVSERFARLQPARSKTFIKASSDPDERPHAPVRGNDDGFSGVNDCESYRYPVGLDELAVLADVQGRAGFMGVFFRNFWSGIAGLPVLAQERNRTQVLIDGAVQYDMALPDFFRNVNDPAGQIAPFTGPFTASRAGGHLTHTPLTWQDSFRIQVYENTFDNANRFHKVAGTLMSPEQLAEVPDIAAWEQVYTRIGGWRHAVPRSAALHPLPLAGPGAPRTIQLQGPGAILEMRCRIDRPDAWNDIRVRMRWDDQEDPLVDVPLRFLGGMVRRPFTHPLDTLFFGNDGANELWTYFPMPFADRADIEFTNLSGQPVQLDVTLATWSGQYPRPWGYFAAQHQQGVTQTGVSFRGPLLTNVQGVLRLLLLEDGADTTGRIPGLVDLTHLEGDLCVRVNGNRGDEHNFAASETSIGKWGWYGTPSDVPFASDTSFNTAIKARYTPQGNIDITRMQGSTYVFDPIQFVDGIDIVLEHGVQNQSNADYALFSVFYLRPGAARATLGSLDVGDTADERAWGVRFGTAPRFELTSSFFRDRFFNTPPITEDGREVRDWYRFPVSGVELAKARGICLGFLLDRPKIGDGDICQARVYVDGLFAGLLHSATSNALDRWKEGGELEVELPRALTDGKESFIVEIRPVAGTDPLRIGRVDVVGYSRD